MYEQLYNDFNNYGDITKIERLPENIDLLFHGSPCQSFSFAGRREGAVEGSGTKSSLMWETVRLVEHSKPKIVIWENVKGVLSKKMKPFFDDYLAKMEELGYTNSYELINAVDCGIPQNRQRIFVASFLNKSDFRDISNYKRRETQDLNKFVDFYSFVGEPHPTYDKTYAEVFKRTEFSLSTFNTDVSSKFSTAERCITGNKTPTMTSKQMGKKNGEFWQYLTNLERFLLSGFTEEDYNKCKTLENGKPRPKSHFLRATGNTIVVQVLECIFEVIYDEFILPKE
jgi:DNA (cytosine-5)-methyltransferase 1